MTHLILVCIASLSLTLAGEWSVHVLVWMQLLARDVCTCAGHKLLLFSTMTTQLDSCEEVLEWQGLRWERLDGTTKAADRGALLHAFSTDPNVCSSSARCIYAFGGWPNRCIGSEHVVCAAVCGNTCVRCPAMWGVIAVCIACGL